MFPNLLLMICVFYGMLCSPGSANAENLPETPTYRLVKIEGPRDVRTTRGKEKILLHANDSLLIGDLLWIAAGQSVEIISDDASKIVVTGESKIQISEHESAAHTMTLFFGRLIGFVHKKLTEHEARKFKYLVKTPFAVMGVRGTQFVVESAEKANETRFHILEGVVDVAKDFTSLLTDNFVVVKTGELVAAVGDQLGVVVKGAGTVTGVAAQGAKDVVHGVTDTVTDGVKTVSKVIPFDMLGFVANLNSQLPEVFHVPFITGSDRVYSEAQAKYHLSSFEFYPQGYFSQSSAPEHGRAFGFGLSWNPTYHIVPGSYDLRAHLGNSRLFQNGHGLFGDIEAKVLATTIVKNAAFFDLGPIYRHYYAAGNGVGVSADGGVWFGDRRVLHLLDRLFFGLNFLTAPNRGMVWEYRFGAGFTIF